MKAKVTSWAKASMAPWELLTKGLYLGSDVHTKRDLYLLLRALETHIYLNGPPGVGKSRLLLWLFQLLSQVPNSTTLLLNCKGKLAQQALTWAIGAGLTKRLIYFPSARGRTCGYNPLQQNGLPPMLRAKAAREAILAGCGASAADRVQMAQLSRWSLKALGAVAERGFTLVEAAELLEPKSEVRAALLPTLQNPQLLRGLSYLDSMRDTNQNLLVQSTLARFDSFIVDEAIRNIVTQQKHSLDLGQVLEERKIVIADLQLDRPFRMDDVRMLGRVMINDLVANVFSRPVRERGPVFLIVDECQNFVTEDLCVAMELGRELGLTVVLANQFLHQLADEDPRGRMLHSVLSCARTKLLFGDADVEDLERLLRDAVISELDPYKVKDELTSLEVEPFEETREVLSTTWTTGGATGVDNGRSWSKDRRSGRGYHEMTAEMDSDGYGNSKARADADLSGLATGQTVLPSGEVLTSQQQHSAGNLVNIEGESELHVHATTHARGIDVNVSEGESEGHQQTLKTLFNWSVAHTRSRVPFMANKKRRVVSSRQFMDLAEQLHLWIQETKAQPQGHFLLKAPNARPRFLEAPWVPTPTLPPQMFAEALEEILSQGCYATSEEIRREEAERTERLHSARQASEFDPEEVWKKRS